LISQHEHGLLPAGRHPCALAGSDAAALGAQQSGEAANEFGRDAEHDTTGNQRGPSRERVWILIETDPDPRVRVLSFLSCVSM